MHSRTVSQQAAAQCSSTWRGGKKGSYGIAVTLYILYLTFVDVYVYVDHLCDQRGGVCCKVASQIQPLRRFIQRSPQAFYTARAMRCGFIVFVSWLVSFVDEA